MIQKKGGFQNLIYDLKNDSKKYKISPQKLVEFLFTHGGRISHDVGKKSLNNFQKAVYLNLKNEKVIFFKDTEQFEVNDTKVGIPIYFGLTQYGRIILNRNLRENEYNEVFGYINFSKECMENVNQLFEKYEKKDRKIYFNEVEPFFESLNKSDLNNIVSYIKFHIYHMAPILLYINDSTYNTFYNFNNLIEELDGDTNYYVLNELVDKSFHDWSQEEKEFVFSMYLLLSSGPPARGEEVNGIHFSLSFLEEYFNSKINSYTKISGNSEQIMLVDNYSLYQKAQYIYNLRKHIEEHYIIYREINGLNLHKKEKFIAKKNTKYFDAKLYNDIMQYLNQSDSGNYYKLFYDTIKTNINRQPEEIIEKIFDIVLNRAIVTTKSDIAMTRGLRAPLSFSEAHDKDNLEKIFNWKQKEYFCCVIPSKKMIEGFKENKTLLAGILTAISKRMQYNSWHYTPGNFLENQKRFTRHFYFPPVMSDITEWSDQHHRGHVFASVNHAIRCPGSIKNHNKRYNAFFDLRLMKQKGDKYSKESLIMALHYKDVLNNLYQSWFDVCKNEKIDIRVDSYDRSWYKEIYVK
ncbi:hypothetical protein K4S62_11510 [Staphylococcus epidermidis]|nr:hypothetical protein [Staphylococcus epidermidis]